MFPQKVRSLVCMRAPKKPINFLCVVFSATAVTHLVLVTDAKGAGKRTFKYLQGLVHGLWIVSTDCSTPMFCVQLIIISLMYMAVGITASIQEGRFKNESAFEIIEDSHKVCGSPRLARLHRWARTPKLFSDFSFHLHGAFTIPSRTDLARLIEEGDGKVWFL